uniref:Ribosomal protein S20 n=1 Tax=Symphyocladiella dendroidea TaxID=2506487 RepID=A0A1Z1M7L1_9FLOR|nr:ribosomal protein S20 [Symphyocladiella dendroidea]ARW61873.1 ribosomal protein S20 [Symphyocladiella dendroidea]
MPKTKSHVKNSKIILRNRYLNRKYKLMIKKAIKTYLLSIKNISSNNSKEDFNRCLNNLSIVYKTIDKAVKRKVLHKNTASRKKSRLASMIN